MNKSIKILLGIAWLVCLSLLIIALTNFIPDNIFQDFKWFILVVFVLLTGAMKEYAI